MISAVGFFGTSIANAQLTSTVPGVQTRIAADPNGVDLVTGSFNYRHVDLSFGPNAGTRLAVVTAVGSGETDAYSGYVYNAVEGGQNFLYVVHGNVTEKFLVSGSTYTSVSGDGISMSHAAGSTNYLMTDRDGTQYSFTHAHYQSNGTYGGSHDYDYLTYIQFVDGERLTITSTNAISQWCDDSGEDGAMAAAPARYQSIDATAPEGHDTDAARSAKAGGQPNLLPPGQHCYSHLWTRVQSVTSNLGYQVRFAYASDAPPLDEQGPGGFIQLVSATGVNLGVDYCDPAATTCTYTRSWPTLLYTAHLAGGQYANVDYTDQLNRHWSITTTGSLSSTQVAIRRPGSGTPYVVATLSNGMVSSVQTPNGTWTYAHSDSGTTRTMTVTDPLNHVRTIVSDLTTGLISSDTDALSHTKSFAYDTYGRVTTATLPEQDSETYSYDGRGNVTQLVRHAKPGSGLADTTASATYPAGCANPASCNSPLTTTDPKGNVTTYEYDPTHGGVTKLTSPAVNGISPETRYTYTALQARYKDASGSVVNSGLPIYRLTATSTCRTTASCAGGADESVSTVDYGTSSGAATNLKPVTVTQRAGDSSVSATVTLGYDEFGNRTSVDGPLPGTGDTARFAYNSDDELLSAMGPDPDGSGPRGSVASRTSYDQYGQVVLTEAGTVPSGASDWTGFQPAQLARVTYDSVGHKLTDALEAGGATVSLTQYGYDAMGRLECSVVRMNPAAYDPLPAACDQGQWGTAGPDRITKTEYDQLSRPIKVTAGYGTAAAAIRARATYNASGQVATATDGNGNTTSYAYDGHERLQRTYWPAATTGAGASNAGDYEELGYDANGNVVTRRLRDGQTIGFSYDALNRVTQRDLPNVYWEDVSYSYDNLGHVTYATDHNPWWHAWTYDALGRVSAQSSNVSSNALQYDAGGRLSRETWADGFYVTYEYDQAGELTAVRENGALALATIGYDALGRRSTLTRGNGTVTSYGYDAASRLASLTQDLAGTGSDLVRTFGYNPAGQVTSRTSSNDAYAWGGAVAVNRTYTVNGLNQYTQSGSVTPTYDARGNLTQAGGQTYQYDPLNQLRGNGTGQLFYRNPIDLLGQSPGANYDYVGDKVVTETGAGVLRRYVYAGEEAPLVWYEGSGTSDRRYLHTDERGSVIAVTNDAGSPLAINTYDEYGIPGANNQGRFQYTGQKWIAELGMYDYKARMYSPTLGRFLQSDPIGYGDGLNAYAYTHNDPINGIDPSGLADTVPGQLPICMPDIIVPCEVIVTAAPSFRDPNTINVCRNDCTGYYGSGPGLPGIAQCGSGGRGSSAVACPNEALPSTETVVGAEVVVTAKKKTDIKACAVAVGKEFIDGFADPFAFIYGYGTSLNEARNRTGAEDYGNPENRFTFRRPLAQAARIGLRRFIPGYTQASLVSGGVRGTMELFKNPTCGLAK